MNKIETVENKKKLFQEKLDRADAKIRRLKRLPAKPVFNAYDKTSDLDKEEKSLDNTEN